MNNTNHQSVVKEATKGAFKGKKELESKAKPRYAQSAEREFQRVNRAYMKLVRDVLKKHMPEIMEICKQERLDSAGHCCHRYDGKTFEEKLKKIFQQMQDEMEQSVGKFDLEKYVDKVSKMTGKLSTREWKRLVKNTLGIDLLDDYYKGELYEQAMKQWVAQNIQLIKSLPQETLGDLETIIRDGYWQGKSLRQLQKEIQESYDISKRDAELLARDQTATLYAQLTEMQHRDAGVTKYKWSTSKDARVRDCHRELDGQIISWDDPPEMWYETKKGRVYTGRHCHPGADYLCRCVAIPVFDWDTIDVPMKGE